MSISASGTGNAVADLRVAAGSTAAFGLVEVGSSKTANFTFKNAGNVPDVGVYVTLGGNYLQLENNTCGTSSSTITLNAGATCTFTVRYAPTGTAVFNGVLNMVTTASTGTKSVALSGTPGQAVLDVSALDLNFGTIQVGASDTKSIVIANTTKVNAFADF